MNRNILSALLIVCISGCTGATTLKPTRKAPPLPPTPPGMKAKKLSTVRSIASVVAPPDSQLRSVARFGDVADDSGSCIAVDRSGNVIVGGTVTVDTGSPHPFLMKRSPSGVVVWSNTFPGNMSGSITALAVDPDGNVLVTGGFTTGISGAFDVGGIVLAGSNSSYDIFVAKIAADGTRALWAKRFGSPRGGFPPDESGNDLAVDTNDNSVVVTGFYGSEAIDFGGGALPVGSGESLFVVKLSALDGSHKWAKTAISASASIKGNGVAIDATGNVFLTGGIGIAGGGTAHVVDFGGGPTAQLWNSMFLAKYSTTGAFVWVKQFGKSAKGTALVVDSGNVTVTGYYNVDINFGGQTLTNVPPPGPIGLPSSTFVANFSAANGAHNWSKKLNGGPSSSGISSGGGNIAVTTVWGYVFSLASNGDERWSKRFAGNSQCNSVATDASGRLSVVGGFKDTVDFGGGPVISTGQSDIFVAEFGAPTPPAITPTGDMAISELYQDLEFGNFYIVSGIQKSNHVIRFEAQDRVGGPKLIIGTWSTYPLDQRVGVSVQAGLPLRWVYSVNTTSAVARSTMNRHAPLTNTGKQTRIGGTNFNVFRSGNMFVLKP